MYQVPAFTPRGPSLVSMLLGEYPPLPNGNKIRHKCPDDFDPNEVEGRECKTCGDIKDLDCFYHGKRPNGTIRYDIECKKCRNARSHKPKQAWKPHPTIALITRRMTTKEFAKMIGKKPSSCHYRLLIAAERGHLKMERVKSSNENEPSIYFSPVTP